MLYTIGIIVLACIAFALSEANSIFSKVLVGSVVCIVGFGLIGLITDSDTVFEIVQFFAVLAVLMVVVPVLIAIFRKD